MKRDYKKYQNITADLLDQIRSGQLKPGDQILSERRLAEQYGVARLTARRALCDLEERGLVKRDGRRGTTVLELPDSSKAQTLTLLCSASPGTLIEEAICQTLIKTGEIGWNARIIRVLHNDEKPMIDALKLGIPTLFLGWTSDLSPSGKLEKAILKSPGHVAVLAGDVEGDNIPAVMCDDHAGMILALKTLKDAGHTQIALITTCADPTHPVASMQIKTWWEEMRPTMSNKELHDNMVVTSSIATESGLVTMHNNLKTFLESPASQKTTAMLCLTEELSTAAIAACRITGRTVPEHMSVLEYGWSQRSKFYNPPRTGINTHMDKHIDTAIDLLMQIRKGKTPEQLKPKIKPELVVGETVAPPYQRMRADIPAFSQ